MITEREFFNFYHERPMDRKELKMLRVIITVLVCGVLCKEDRLLKNARKLIRDNIMIDAHNDFPDKIRNLFSGRIYDQDLRNLDKRFHTDLNRLKKGGIKAQIWSAFVSCGEQVKEALEQVDLIKRIIKEYNDTLEIATSPADIRNISKSGKIASLIGLEGAHAVGVSIPVLRMFYELGARILTLTHSCSNEWSDSSMDDSNSGLTQRGREAVIEMNRLGMMIDISHVSFQTMTDVLQISKVPVIFSHSSAFTLCPNKRNVPDDILEKVKEKDGIVMINFYPEYITCSSNATLIDVANHIDYISKKIGRDKVGFGSDFDGISSTPLGLQDVSTYPYLVASLLQRNWSNSDIIGKLKRNFTLGLLGENFLRVYTKISDFSFKIKPIESRYSSKICVLNSFSFS
jgi:membrane dipeptidase